MTETQESLEVVQSTAVPQIAAFYGYKGGAGRSLLAANVAASLAVLGKNVLLIDWDLEAPGIGDFLEAQDFDPEKTKDGVRPNWRRRRGVFDLLLECAEAEGKNQADKLAKYLEGEIASRKVGSGRLDLLGPGLQVGNDFEISLLGSDWFNFFKSYGEEFRAAFRQEISKKNYHAVIIDTRTGINLSTVFVLRFLAKLVFFVSPKTNQALQGSYGMWRLVNRKDFAPEPPPECRMILARHKDTFVEGEDAALAFVKEKMDKEPFQLPYLKSISDSEQLFFDNSKLREKFFPSIEATPPDPNEEEGLRSYVKAFWDICAVVDPSIKPQHTDLKAALEAIGKREPKAQQLDDGKEQVRKLLHASNMLRGTDATRKAGGEAKSSAIASSSTSDAIGDQESKLAIDAAIDNLTKWLDEASPLQRGTLTIFMANEKVDQLRLPREILDRLPFDSEDTAGDVPASPAELPDDSEETAVVKQPVESIEAVPPPEKDSRQSATAKWREGRAARDEGDDPVLALRLLEEALRIVTYKLSKDDGKERNELLSDRSIYVWEIASTLGGLAVWDAAMARIWGLLEDPDIPESRSPEDTRTTTRSDLQRVLLSLACDKLEAAFGLAEEPPDSKTLEKLKRDAEALEEWLGTGSAESRDRFDAQRVLTKFRLLTEGESAARQHLESAAANSRDFLRSMEQGSDPDVSWIADCARSEGMLVRLCDEPSMRSALMERFDKLLADGSAVVGAWIWPPAEKPKKPANADGVNFLAQVVSDRGRPLAALALREDALQLIETLPSGRANLQRIDTVRSISIQESFLGRPDLAVETWKSLSEFFKQQNPPPPEQSIRARFSKSLEWWDFAASYEMGDYETAKKLDVHHKNFEQTLKQTDLTAANRFQVRSELNSITQWLAAVELALGNYDRSIELANEWKRQLDGLFYLEVDAARRLAKSREIVAEACYCAGRHPEALAAIEEGLKKNRNGAEAFGWLYQRVQAELAILDAEIRAFGPGSDSKGLEETLIEALNAIEPHWEGMEKERDWFYTDRVRLGKAFATAAGVFLKIGSTAHAKKYADDVLQKWLNFPAAREETEGLKWVAKIAAVPRALACAVSAKLADGTQGSSERERAAELWGGLPESTKQRYRNIFHECEVVPVTS